MVCLRSLTRIALEVDEAVLLRGEDRRVAGCPPLELGVDLGKLPARLYGGLTGGQDAGVIDVSGDEGAYGPVAKLEDLVVVEEPEDRRQRGPLRDAGIDVEPRHGAFWDADVA